MTYFIKKTLTLIFIISLTLSFLGCGAKTSDKEEQPESNMWRIGVCQSDNSEYGDIIHDGF